MAQPPGSSGPAASSSTSSPRTPRFAHGQSHLPRPPQTSPTASQARPAQPSGSHLPFAVSRDSGELSSFPRYEEMSHYALAHPASGSQEASPRPWAAGFSPGKNFLHTMFEGVGKGWSGRKVSSGTEGDAIKRTTSNGSLGGSQPSSPLAPQRSRTASVSNAVPPSPTSPLAREASANGNAEAPSPPADDDDEGSVWLGRERLSSWSLILLTLAIAGAQVAWTVELGAGTPFLLSLGLSASLTSLVWLAGPLSGLLIQPLVGALSDRSRSRFRRRKYIFASLFLCALSTVTLAFSQSIGRLLSNVFSPGEGDWDPKNPRSANGAAVAVAVVSFYVLDFALNGLQAASRALILDRAPAMQQSTANAWHGRMTHVGNVVGYGTGVLDLADWQILAWLGGGQFRKLCVVGLLFLLVCVGITCATQDERATALTDNEGGSAISTQDEPRKMWRVGADAAKDIWRTLRDLPVPIRRVCIVQLFAWCSWFPFLFYASTYVAQTFLLTTPSSGDDEVDMERALRKGSQAMLAYAFVSVVSGGLLPWITTVGRTRYVRTRPTSSAAGGSMSGVPGQSKAKVKGKKTAKTWDRLRRILACCTPRNFWTASLLFFFILMCCTFGVSTVHGASTVIAMLGVPWAVACWVPFALLMEYIRELEDVPAPTTCLPPEARPTSPSPARAKVERPNKPGRRRSTGKGQRQVDRALDECTPLLSSEEGERREREEMEEGSGGTILGIHNLSIVVPQFVVALIAAAIFRIVDATETAAASLSSSGDGFPTDGDARLEGKVHNDVVWVLRFGGLMALAAAAATRWIIPPPSEVDYWDDLLEWQMYQQDGGSDLDREE